MTTATVETMTRPIRVLLVEDSPEDAELMEYELKRMGLDAQCIRVETELDYVGGLAEQPHIILADYSLPQFGAMPALRLLQREGLDIPFLIVTGSVGEEAAVECIREGATDYILKGSLSRLGPAIERALREKHVRDERRMAQRALRESEEHFRSVIESVRDLILVIDDHGRLLYESPSIQSVLGYQQGERLGDPVFAMIHPEDLDLVEHRIERGFQNPGTTQSMVARFRHANGSYRILESVGSAHVTANGLRRGVINARDITAREESEARLRESESRYRSLVENAPICIYELDNGARIASINSAGTRMLGHEQVDQVLGLTFLDVVDVAFRDRVESTLAKVFNGEPAHVEFQGVGKIFGASYYPLRDDSGAVVHITGLMQDITDRQRAAEERSRLEEQLRQAQKLEAIGQLAGGVAHDFNNLLTVIGGYADFIESEPEDREGLKEGAREIRKAQQRGASLTRQLLAFARKQVLQPVVLDINQVVRDIENFLSRLIGEHIDLVLHLSDAQPRATADAGQMEQVIMNLAVNARDAMPDGGVLSIETRVCQASDLDGSYGIRDANARYVEVVVTDTGSGMDEETRLRIFEPFFTTKARGKGTGLGLSTVYGIVEQSRGHLAVASKLGVGSTFKFCLPMTEERVAAPPQKRSTDGSAGNETILVAEDDDGIRRLIRTILGRLGYTILEGADGAAALEEAKKHTGPIDLLLTDLVMPGMSGTELAARFAETYPDIPVLYMSGYTDDIFNSSGIVDRRVQLVIKPFAPSALAERVRTILDSAARPTSPT